MPPQSPVPSEMLGRPFLLQTAERAGVSRQVLRGRRFRRMYRSVYVSAETPHSLEVRVDAVRLLMPDGAVLSHHAAALLRGLPVPPTDQVHVTVAPGSNAPRVAGVCTHRASATVTRHRGRQLSGPAESFLELAETLGLVDLVILGDAMIRRGLLTCEGLMAEVSATRRRRGVRIARRAAGLVRPGVDSPMETRVRLLLVLGGLPEPIPNLVVRDAEGGWIGAVDLAYESCRLAIEYHGDVHRSTPGQWRADVAKTELLGRLGWRVIIVTAADMFRAAGRTLRRVHDALTAAGHPSVPAELDPGWRQHFPGSAHHAEVGHARGAA